MNREQRKYLKEKLNKLERRQIDAIFTAPPIPKSVAAARRVVEAWSEKQRGIQRIRKARLDEAYSASLEAILLKEFPDALRAVKEFERFQP